MIAVSHWAKNVALAVVLSLYLIVSAQAQLLSRYIPDYAPGLTDNPEDPQARVQPEYRSDGVRTGLFVIRPHLSESLGYDSNVDGVTSGRMSPSVNTQAAVDVQSDWSRNSLGAQLSVNDQRYPGRPVQDFTNWSAGVSGTYDIGLDQVDGSYQHLNVVQTPRDLGAVLSVPVPFQVDDIKLGTELLTRGRLSFVPDLDVASYRFGSSAGLGSTVDGLNVTLGQTWQSRLVYQGEVTTRYELSPRRNALLVLRGTAVDFTAHPAGVGNRNSVGGAVLVGLDTSGSGVFRYRALIGYQERNYASAQYATIRSPIIEASVTWTPHLDTTMTVVVRQEIDDSTDVNFAATTTTSLQLNVAHELRRNVVLTGFGEYQRAEFDSNSQLTPQAAVAPTQNIYSAGVGTTWFVDRRTRLGLSYQFVDRRGDEQSSYSENIALFTVGFGL